MQQFDLVAMVQNEAYESLSEELAAAGVVPSLAELHGGLCGVMCVGGVAAADRWLVEHLEEWRQSGESTLSEALHALEQRTWRKLNGEEMAFEPLLPAEDRPLDAQVHALASWCHGFLGGLGVGGLRMTGEEPDTEETIAEITKDFSEISRAVLGPDDTEDLDEAGFALEELKQYVRVSVQLVFEHFSARSLGNGSGTIH